MSPRSRQHQIPAVRRQGLSWSLAGPTCSCVTASAAHSDGRGGRARLLRDGFRHGQFLHQAGSLTAGELVEQCVDGVRAFCHGRARGVGAAHRTFELTLPYGGRARSLSGTSTATPFGEVEQNTHECDWYSFGAATEWFEGVARDIGLVSVAPKARRIAVLAATDTD
ncbi:DUF6183 family protein [Streptomyces nigra]|uniref:DUF6183 family protein n=1 Tax=Streptomyces nigra TaxID=1827580 RepID=UPI003697A01C